VSNSRQPKKFTFERLIPVISIGKKKKSTNLNGDLFNKSTTAADLQIVLQNNVVVSPSGRTLSQILSLSCPEELSTYHIESVNARWGKEGTVVKYSRPQGTEAVIVLCINFHASTYSCVGPFEREGRAPKEGGRA
jgi:hypothetical protein